MNDELNLLVLPFHFCIKMQRNNRNQSHTREIFVRRENNYGFSDLEHLKEKNMAEIISRNKNSKKPMPRVDLTPMVDLGFLLITFFIVTTSMSHPSVMKCNLPAAGSASKSAESKTLNLVLSKDNQINYFDGNDSLHSNRCNYNNSDLTIVINKKQLEVEKKFGNKNELFILIKPTTQASYKNLVDVLDEMTIHDVSRYMLVKANNFEETLFQK